MLDIKFIQDNQAKIEEAIKNKGVDLDLSKLLKLSDDRKVLLQKKEDLNRQKNENADKIKQAGGKPDTKLISAGKKIKQELDKLEPKFKKLDTEYDEFMLLVPNVYSDDTPIGQDDTENKVIRTWGDLPKFKFDPIDHIELGKRHDMIDTERGVKISGFRGYFLKNDLALLHWALLTYALNKIVAKGFQPMITPSLVNEEGLYGSGWFPTNKEETYQTDDKYLSGTAEIPLMSYRSNEIIKTEELPLKYAGFSLCYRKEAGSYGKDTKGLYRLHEFWKVEQIVICKNDINESLKIFEQMLGYAEEILQDLKLPYRVLQICTGDMGAGKYKMYDLETWMPSRNAYSETHSCSHLTDWQTRRLKIRYRDENDNMVYPHALNNTVIASPRILIAILENYQNQDGSIEIPKVLQSLVGKKVIK